MAFHADVWSEQWVWIDDLFRNNTLFAADKFDWIFYDIG